VAAKPVAEEDKVILFTIFADHQGSAGFFPFHTLHSFSRYCFPVRVRPERADFDNMLLLYHFFRKNKRVFLLVLQKSPFMGSRGREKGGFVCFDFGLWVGLGGVVFGRCGVGSAPD
jgi:hypothetical protein